MRATNEALRPVMEDHELLLRQVHALDKVLMLIWSGTEDEAEVRGVLMQMRQHFLHDLLRHLAEEERVFFPAVERLPQGEWKAARLRAEHAALRAAVDEFRAGWTLLGYVGPESRRGLLWRLVSDSRAILGLLRSHAAFEHELLRELNNLTGKQGGNSAVPPAASPLRADRVPAG